MNGLSLSELSQIQWRAPAACLIVLLPLVPLLFARWLRPTWERYADKHLQAWALRHSGTLAHFDSHILWQGLMWASLACALAGPRLPLAVDAGVRAQHVMDIMVVLDVSSSMAAGDITPTRLQRAKLELQDLQTRLHGERLGLIVYAGEAGLLSPLSHDLSAFQEAVALADDSLFDEAGSNLGAALRLAQKTLNPRKRPGAILLLSDTEASSLSGASGEAALAAAGELRKAKIPLYILALGTEAGSTIPLRDGGEAFQDGASVVSRADFAGYRALAKLSGGLLVPVRDGDADWAQLYESGLLTISAPVDASDSSRAWRELFAYPLALALLILFAQGWRFKRRGVLALAALGSLNAQADDGGWRSAYTAYTQGAYLNAQQAYASLPGFDARMGEGAAAYKRRDYSYAREQFSAAWLAAKTPSQSADALFNLGNSFYFSGAYVAAVDAYGAVLNLRPQDQRARQNLRAAQIQLARRAAAVAQAEGIPGKRGRGVGDAAFDPAAPLSMAPNKDENRPLQAMESLNARNAHQVGMGASFAASATEANQSAALKQLDLLKDYKATVSKQMLKQDAERAPPVGMQPW